MPDKDKQGTVVVRSFSTSHSGGVKEKNRFMVVLSVSTKSVGEMHEPD